MTTGLSVARVINVQVNLAPTAAQFANINSALILGDSDIIDTQTRIRSYNTLASVATDFGTSAPEYAAAALFFAQAPQPTQLYIGRWARLAIKGRLFGAPLTATQQTLSNFTSVVSGGFKIQVDGAGAPVNVAAINLSTATNLNAVATLINTALASATVGATVAWNAAYNQFVFTSATNGTTSKVLPLTAPTSGVDLSPILGGVTGTREVDGIAQESLLSAVTLLDGMTTYWYGLTTATQAGTTNSATNTDYLAIAAYIQGSAAAHIYGVSSSEAAAIDATQTSDIGYLLQLGGYTRTFAQYSSTTLYSAASMLGRLITVDFTANNSTITLAFKQEPGIVAESLTATQAAALDGKRYNYFVNYNNATAIVQNGWCSGPAYIDEIFGLDWLANNVQTNLYNVLYTSPTKIPQTDAGINMLVNGADASCSLGRTNGLIAPGTWTTGGFGSLNTGDFMPNGFYVYAPPVALQAAADRQARKSPTLQIAVKLAGAVQSVNAIISVNR